MPPSSALSTDAFSELRCAYGAAPRLDGYPRAYFVHWQIERHIDQIGAFDGNNHIGFVQLYPTYSSVAMKPKLILNDMFVELSHRRSGAARSLLSAAEQLARGLGAISLVLATRLDNEAARRLYQRTGWTREESFTYYNRTL